MELKNKISELKNSIEEFNSRLEHRKKDSMNLKTGHLKLSSQTAKIMKKLKGFMVHHQADQYTY